MQMGEEERREGRGGVQVGEVLRKSVGFDLSCSCCTDKFHECVKVFV